MAQNYNDLIMIDFPDLVDKKSDQLAFYLNEPEKLSFENEAACNMQQEIYSSRLAKFSTVENDFT